MHRLSSIILVILGITQMQAQSPHGESYRVDCAQCHNPAAWSIKMDTFQFNHDTISFQLEGTHLLVDCKSCHIALVFEETASECISCHEDIHSMSVGDDCVRCHTPQTWLVDYIPELHEENGFPLIGTHSSLSCVDCHVSETNLRLDRVGNECVSCHLEDYQNSENPNHQEVGYSIDNCAECHDLFSEGWSGGAINHFFFPLTLGHDTQDCLQCHLTPKFSDTSPDCVDCHQTNYNDTTNPDHVTGFFPMDCALCHTTDPGWQPANFSDHDDQLFPIYSGKHEGEWNLCIDCHTDVNDYAVFNCINCHNDQSDLSNEHDEVSGYSYTSNACFDCHPKGDSD